MRSLWLHQAVLHVHELKALYGMLVLATLFYKKLKRDLIGYGFKVNRTINECIIAFRSLKVSPTDANAVDESLMWTKEVYGRIGEFKTTQGKCHEYLGMKLDYSQVGLIRV